MEMPTIKRILAINFGGIGDEILFLPTLKNIREAHPQAAITLLLEPRSRSISELTDLIDEVVAFDIKKRPLYPLDLIALLSMMRYGRYDAVVSSGSSALVAVLLFLSGIAKRVGYAHPLSQFLLTDAITLNYNQYAACMYQELAQGLGAQADAVCLPQVVLQEESLAKMRRFLAKNERSIISGAGEFSGLRVLIHPGASRLAAAKGIIKTWPSTKWLKLINHLSAYNGLQIVMAAGPDDQELVRELQPQLSNYQAVISAVGQTGSLSDLAALMHLCDLVVCVDSAPMHLAVALNKPLVALFGPTDERKLLPFDRKFLALRDKPMAECPRRLDDGLGVPLQPDIVGLSVVDQLRRWSCPRSSRMH